MTTKDEALWMALDIPMSEVQFYVPETTTSNKRRAMLLIKGEEA